MSPRTRTGGAGLTHSLTRTDALGATSPRLGGNPENPGILRRATRWTKLEEEDFRTSMR